MSTASGDLPVVFTAAELAAHDQAVRTDALCEFAEYLAVKAANAEGRVPGSYADGMRLASVDAELFVTSIRGKWRE